MQRLLLILLLCCCQSGLAAPTGADLLEACQDSINQGLQGKEGLLCHWYVTPCDCKTAQENNLPRVCLPDTIAPEKLANIVIKGIQQEPTLRTESAAMAASLILARLYPCDEGS